jgi:hypothetical protein
MTVIYSNNYGSLSAIAGIIVFSLLLCLLVEKEIMRAIGGMQPEMGAKAIDLVIIPLLLPFFLIIGLRFLQILQPG